MLTDTSQGVLIGVLGVLLGSIVTGIISFAIAKQQIKANLEATAQQLAHEKHESLIQRKLHTREKVLLPLREALSSSITIGNHWLMMTVQMQAAHKKADKEEIIDAESRWCQASKKSDEADMSVEVLRNQITDPELDQLMDDLLSSKQKESINIARCGLIANMIPGDLTVDSVTEITDELKEIRKRIFCKSLKVNKRIETLLSEEL